MGGAKRHLRQEDHKPRLTFGNGETRVFDAAPLLEFPCFRRLRNPVFFSLARVDCGCVVWPTEIDCCPDMLYLESVPLQGA